MANRPRRADPAAARQCPGGNPSQQVAQRWQAVVAELEQDPQAKELLDELQATFRANTRLDLNGLAGGGDYPAGGTRCPGPPPLAEHGSGFIIESSQKEKANAALAQLDRLLQELGAQVNRRPSELGGSLV